MICSNHSRNGLLRYAEGYYSDVCVINSMCRNQNVSVLWCRQTLSTEVSDMLHLLAEGCPGTMWGKPATTHSRIVIVHPIVGLSICLRIYTTSPCPYYLMYDPTRDSTRL